MPMIVVPMRSRLVLHSPEHKSPAGLDHRASGTKTSKPPCRCLFAPWHDLRHVGCALREPAQKQPEVEETAAAAARLPELATAGTG